MFSTKNWIKSLFPRQDRTGRKAISGRRRRPCRLVVEQLEDRNLLSLFNGGLLQGYVAQVYQDLLGRPVDPAGMSSWSGFLNSGNSPADMIRGIENSHEYHVDQVQSLYTTLLDRPADAAGLNGFVSELTAGGTLEQVEAAIAGSSEYFQNHGQSTTQGFLGALYQDILGRPIDTAGQQAFSRLLVNGTSRADVAAQLLSSAEYRQDVVLGAYHQFLSRNADPAGFNSWVSALQNGVTDDGLIAGFMGSAEYYSFDPSQGPLNAPQPLETTTQVISASQGGTLTLPDGSSLTIPAGALPVDEPVTLSLFVPPPKLSPGRLFQTTGPTLDLSFGSSAQSPPSGWSPSNADLQFQLNLASRPGVDGTTPAALADVVDLSGGDTFVGIPRDNNSTSPTLTVPASLLGNSQEITVSLARANPKIYVPPPLNLPPQTSQALLLDSSGNWVALPTNLDLRCKRVLVLIHGMLSSVDKAFPNAAQLKVEGGYDEVIGFNYNWTQHIDASGAELAALLNSLTNAAVIDTEAHSEGGQVLLSAYTQTTANINSMTLLGVPITGTPIAIAGLGVQVIGSYKLNQLEISLLLSGGTSSAAGLLLNIASHIPISKLGYNAGFNVSLNDILNGPWAADLIPLTLTLFGKVVNFSLADRLVAAQKKERSNPTPIYVAAGDTPFLAAETNLFFNGVPNDGMIPVDSALGKGSGLEARIKGIGPALGQFSGLSHADLFFHQGLVTARAVVQAVAQASGHPKLIVTPDPKIPLTFKTTQCAPAGFTGSKPLTIRNIGSRYSDLEFTVTAPWFLTGGPPSGQTAYPLHWQQSLTFMLSPKAGLAAGSYTGFITITDQENGNIKNCPVNIAVTVTVDPCAPPPSPSATPAQDFVTSVYFTLLHRQPDAQGLASWQSALNNGLSRTQMVTAVENSPEHLRIIVDVLYHLFLNRAADPADMEAWSQFLNSGGTLEQMEAGLAGSQEFYQSEGGGTDQAFVQVLYQYALNRDADPMGQATFDQALAGGASPADVANAIFGSQEFLQDEVNNYYMQFLHRPADSAGLNGWVSALESGQTDAAGVIAGIMGSNEYLSANGIPNFIPKPSDPFAGSYTGTYNGTAFLDNGLTYAISGPVAFTEANGVITVTVPVSGTGTLSSSGSASFASGVGIGSSGNATAQFSGTFTVTASGVVASGSWSSSFPPSGPIPGGTANGTWQAAH